ncbi:hypothetical protein BC943DRAFT_324463 [Umbelopsis sp. AD052]|nr:hypothetical protein BC943DRAFT_324463 [Umbelopsis sp. AD052]
MKPSKHQSRSSAITPGTGTLPPKTAGNVKTNVNKGSSCYGNKTNEGNKPNPPSTSGNASSNAGKQKES